MKIVCFSDAHWHFSEVEIPKGDVLVYAGDWCSGEDLKNTNNFANLLGTQPHKTKIVVAGNHDIIAERNQALVTQIFNDAGVVYLQDQSVIVEGVQFYGSPWTPTYKNWAFMRDEDELSRIWRGIPPNTDVFITHGPAFGILDKLPEFGSVGSTALEQAIIQKKPRIHICGHIHSAYGEMESDNTHFYNVSLCDDEYSLKNKPKVIEV